MRSARGVAAVIGLVTAFAFAAAPAGAVSAAARPTTAQASKFARAAHEDLLGSDASASFLAKWSTELASGSATRTSFITALAASPASAQAQVTRTYEDVLFREPSPTALAGWSAQIERHQITEAKLAATLYASDEYVTQFGGGTIDGWVDRVYRRLVGWVPNAAQHAKWVAAATSKGRTYVAAVLYETDYAASLRVAYLYALLPGNSQARRPYWTTVDQAHGDLAVVQAFLVTDEYFTYSQTRVYPQLTSHDVTVLQGVPNYVPLPVNSATYQATAVGLPSGLSVGSETGRSGGERDNLLIGTPPAIGTTTVTVTSTGGHPVATTVDTLRVHVVAPTPLSGATQLLLDHISTGGAPYRQESFTCALATGGETCWGGYGGFLGSLYPFPSAALPALRPLTSDVTQLVTGWERDGCVLRTGGYLECHDSLPDVTLRTLHVTGFGLSAGDRCVIADRDVVGEVWCEGNNLYGELGTGSPTPLHSDSSVQVLGVSGATSVVGGTSSFCAVATGGHVWCWGADDHGQVGNGTTNANIGVATPVELPSLSGVTSLTAQGDTFCAVNGDGTLWCWGANDAGQVGTGGTADVSTPTQVPGLTGVTALERDTTTSTTCALANAGHVSCWGANPQGQLGNNTTSPSSTPVAVSGLTTVTSLPAASYGTPCAKVSTTAISCWGANGHGQVGDGSTTDRHVATAVSGLPTLAGFWLRSGGACAAGASSFVCWGSNDTGQVGDGTTTDALSPSTVTGPTAVTDYQEQGGTACAIASAHQVWCWGDDTSGQVGDGLFTVDTTVRVVPTPFRVFTGLG